MNINPIIIPNKLSISKLPTNIDYLVILGISSNFREIVHQTFFDILYDNIIKELDQINANT